jgi:hypothetical protein
MQIIGIRFPRPVFMPAAKKIFTILPSRGYLIHIYDVFLSRLIESYHYVP